MPAFSFFFGMTRSRQGHFSLVIYVRLDALSHFRECGLRLFSPRKDCDSCQRLGPPGCLRSFEVAEVWPMPVAPSLDDSARVFSGNTDYSFDGCS